MGEVTPERGLLRDSMCGKTKGGGVMFSPSFGAPQVCLIVFHTFSLRICEAGANFYGRHGLPWSSYFAHFQHSTLYRTKMVKQIILREMPL